MDKTVIHTAATLAAMHERDPRELDALAAELIPVPNLRWETLANQRIAGFLMGSGFFRHFEPSSDLNHAALLEQELARRGLNVKYADELVCVLNGKDNYPIVRHFYGMYEMSFSGAVALIFATAAQRTIAAVLAVQEVVA